MISIIFLLLSFSYMWTWTEMVSLSDFDQQQHPDAISTINNKHYQFHEYDENSFSENESSDAMQSALNRGPYFDVSQSRNVTALVGSTAYLNCRVRNLGNKTVWKFFLCMPLRTSSLKWFVVVALQVSWIRHRDLHLLTINKETYTQGNLLTL